MRMMKESGIEWIGEIPEKWGVVLLSSLFSHHKSKNVGLQETNLLSLSYGRIVRKDITTSEGLLPESFETYNIVDVDDIVFRLTDLQNDKRSLRTGLCKEKGIITSAYTVIRPTTSSTDSRYLQYLYHAYDICKVFYGLGDGVRQGMGFDDLKKIPTLVPALEEQKKIADFLDGKCAEIDELVQTEEKMIEELKAYKQSVITEAVTKGLDSAAPMKDSGIEWIGEIPESWEVLSLKRLFSARRGGAWGEDATNNEGDIICLRVADFNYDELCIKEGDKTIRNYSPQTIKNLRLKSNDLLIEKSGGGEKTPVGRCILPTGYEGCLYANFIDRLTIKTNCYNKYIVYLMSVAYLNRINTPHIKQTTGIQNLDMEGYLSEDVAIPSLDEQKQIADYLDEKCAKIDEMIAIRNEQIDQLKEYKKSLIYEYVTGKKEVV